MQVFKPAIDDRFSKDRIVSHSEQSLDARVVRDSKDLLKALDDRVEVIGIDEVQFFDTGIVEVCERLANMGRRIIVAGLDLDYRGVPFEPVPQLMAMAEYVTKTLAICSRCGAPACRSQRVVAADARIVVGATDAYEARCRRCFEPDLPQQLAMDLPTED